MKILFFASLAEITGQPEITVDDIKSLEQLKQLLIEQFPGLAGMNFSVAVNKIITHTNIVLHETDEVALLPPFSGG